MGNTNQLNFFRQFNIFSLDGYSIYKLNAFLINVVFIQKQEKTQKSQFLIVKGIGFLLNTAKNHYVIRVNCSKWKRYGESVHTKINDRTEQEGEIGESFP